MSRQSTQLDVRLGERIRRARKEAGISSSELARRLEVGERTVTRWQAGALVPSLPRLYDIADVLGKPVGYFLEEPV